MKSLSFDTFPLAYCVATSGGSIIVGSYIVSIVSLMSDPHMYFSPTYLAIDSVVFVYWLTWPCPIFYTCSEKLAQFPVNLVVDTCPLRDAPPLPLLFFGVSPTLASPFSTLTLDILMTVYVFFSTFMEIRIILLLADNSRVMRRVMLLILIIFLCAL